MPYRIIKRHRHHKKLKWNIESFYIILFSIMPLMDSLNGYFIISGIRVLGSIGQLYRLLLLLFLIAVSIHHLLKKQFTGLLLFFGYLVASCLVHIFTGTASSIKQELSQLYIWGLLPLLMLCTISLLKRKRISSNSLYRCIRNITLIAPLTIIIPKVLGVGYSTYSDGSGFKGFFYANNGISFVLSISVIYETYHWCTNTNLYNTFRVILLMLSCVLVGTQSCFLSIGIAIILGLVFAYKKSKLRGIKTTLIIVPVFLVAIVFILKRYKDSIVKLIERRLYFQSVNLYDSPIDYITSGRLVKLKILLGDLRKSSLISWLFGIGRQDEIAEMDFFDYGIQFGILGILVLLMLYMVFQRYRKFHSLFTKWLLAFAVVYSFIVGHVFNNAMSSMLLLLLICEFEERCTYYTSKGKIDTF